MRVYGLICDCGDGSSSLRWFLDEELVEVILETEDDYYANEGSPATTLTLPEGVTPESIGITISNYTRADFGLDD